MMGLTYLRNLIEKGFFRFDSRILTVLRGNDGPYRRRQQPDGRNVRRGRRRGRGSSEQIRR